MWVSTFHSACVRILRRDGQSIGLASGFSIYDTADCERLVKLIGADLNIDLKRYTPRAILSRISDYKNSLIGWQEQLKRYAPDYRPASAVIRSAISATSRCCIPSSTPNTSIVWPWRTPSTSTI